MSDKNAQDRFLDRLIEDLEADRLVLPTLPEVALRVRDAVEDPDASAERVSTAISQDTALSARLIQVVNSPLYRAAKSINDLQIAVARLGMRVVRNLVTSMVMQQIFQPTTDVLDKRFRALWEHSVNVAGIARALAKGQRGLAPDEALLGGLIHDIGTLPILSRAEEQPELATDPWRLEQMIEALHTRIGAIILRRWEFPAPLVTVAAEHEDFSRTPAGGNPDYTDVVQVANLQSYFATNHRLAGVDWATVGAFARLGISTDVEEIDLEQTSEDVETLRGLL